MYIEYTDFCSLAMNASNIRFHIEATLYDEEKKAEIHILAK